MDESMLPIIAPAASAGKGPPDPAQAALLGREVDALNGQSSDAVAALAAHLQETAAGQLATGQAGFNGSIGSVMAGAMKLMAKSDKGVSAVSDALTSRANSQIDATRNAVRNAGGDLPILLPDIVATNHLGLHETVALERVVLPMIDAQMVDDGHGGLKLPEVAPPPIEREVPRMVPGMTQTTATVPPMPTPPGPVTVGPPIYAPAEPVPPAPVMIDTGASCPAPVMIEPEPPPPGSMVCVPAGSPLPSVPPPPGGVTWTPTPVVIPGTGQTVMVPMPSVPPPATSTSTSPPPPTSPPRTEPGVYPSTFGGTTTDGGTVIGPDYVPPPPDADPVQSLIQQLFGSGGTGDRTRTTPVGPMDGPTICDALKAALEMLSGGSGDYASPEFDAKLKEGIEKASQIPFVGGIIATIGGGLLGFLKMIGDATAQMGSSIGLPNPVVVASTTAVRAIFDIIARWTGIDTSYYLQGIDRAAKAANPMNSIGQAETDELYLRGIIDLEQWECMTRANGNMLWQHQQALFAKSQVLSVNDLIEMRRKDVIGKAEFFERARRAGVLDPEVAAMLYDNSVYTPTASDIFKWLVKDVANEDYIQFAKLDDGFDSSWSPELQKMANAAGLTADFIKYEYRSQWELPNKTENIEMIRRLRPGRVSKDLEWTVEAAKKTFMLNEVPLAFQERYVAIAYLPINLTQIQSAYIAGTMSEAEVLERIQDVGYSLDDAKALTKATVQKGEQQTQSSFGGWTRRNIIKAYIEGMLHKNVAERLLSRTLPDKARIADALQDADDMRTVQTQRKCLNSIKKRYMTGEFSQAQGEDAATQMGLERLTALDIVAGWECERKSRVKEPNVKMLKEWRDHGIIDANEMYRRLTNLGYLPQDATRIIAADVIEFNDKQAKEAEKAARQAKADARQAKKDKEDAEKEQAKQDAGRSKPKN